MASQGHRRHVLAGSLGALFGAMSLKSRATAQTAPAASTLMPPRPSIATYAATPRIDNIALSPDGTRIALVTQQGDEKFLNNIDIATGQLQQLGLGPAKIRELMWADDNHVMVISSVTQRLAYLGYHKHELHMARIVNLSTLKVVGLFSHNSAFYEIVMGMPRRIKTADGYNIIAVNAMLREPYPLCLYRFEMDSESGELVGSLSFSSQDWVLTPDGAPLAYSGYAVDNKLWSIFYLKRDGSVSGGSSADAAPWLKIYQNKDPSSRCDLIGLGRDGKSLLLHIVKTDKDGDAVDDGGYFELSPDGTLGEVTYPEGSRAGLEPLFHPTTWRFCGFLRQDDWVTYDFHDAELKKIHRSVQDVLGADNHVTITDYAENLSQVIVRNETRTDPGSYIYIDLLTNKVVKLPSNYPDLPPQWISEKVAVRYKAKDELEIHGYLSLPPNKEAKNLPLVLLPHGGPELRDFGDFDWQAQIFASLGYAVLQPNFRGSSGYGYDFVKAGHGEWGRKMQTDLSDGVRWLVAQGMVDPKRVAIVGASYGGYAALAGATLDLGVYNCAVSIAGVSDVEAMLRYEAAISEGGMKSAVVKYSKRFLGNPDSYDQISPVKQAVQASCPILLIHGEDDTVVPIDQSRRMEKALKAAGKPVEFINYKGQDHWETIESARIDMMTRVVDFLGRYNPA